MYSIIDLEIKKTIHEDTTEKKCETWLNKHIKVTKQPLVRYVIIEALDKDDVIENDCYS